MPLVARRIPDLNADQHRAAGQDTLFDSWRFHDVPLNVELKLEVWDSPNSAGVIIDALRCKIAQDRGIGGPLLGPSAYFMKSPPIQYRLS